MSDKRVVRTKQTGDKVYVVENNTARWVKNPETLYELGFDFGSVENIEQEEFFSFDRDEPIDLKEEYQANSSSQPETVEVKTNAGEILNYKENV